MQSRHSFILLLILIISLLLIRHSVWAQDSCKTVLDKKTEKIYHEAIEFYKKGNYTLASASLKNVLKSFPECADAYYMLGLINFKKSEANLKDAEKYFRKLLELCPDYEAYAYFYLGEILYGQENYEMAVKYLELFLKDVDKIKTDEDYNRATELLRYSEFYLEITKNPVPFEPKVVEGISTSENEYLPILSPDNQLAFFTREKKLPPDRNTVISNIRTQEKFMFSIQDSEGKFTSGEEMPDPFNLNANEGGATLTADNNTLYYTVCKYDKEKKYLNCDIYFSENINGAWTPIKGVSNRINLAISWESQPSISADGKTLYFVSDRSGGFGGYDIYRTIKSENGEWGTPMNLGPTINSSGNEKSPFIHPDGKTLYFSSDGWMGIGGYDIFYSRLGENGNWLKAKNIGYPINSTEDELGFFVSTEGEYGYFASNKFNGKGGWDLYSFELYPGARPEKVLFIKGTISAESMAEPVKVRIELKNIETKRISEIPLDTMTGNYFAVAPFNSDYIMTVKKEGYVYESKYIAKTDTNFQTPARVDVEIKPIELNKSYRINDIYFAFNSFDLTSESKEVLDQLLEFLLENPNISIEIQGHTDNIGNDAANLRLSAERAKSVYNYLITKSIPEARLTYKGFGKSQPVSTNDNEEGRAKNRRTVFVITRK